LIDIVVVAQSRSNNAAVEGARSEKLLQSYEQVQKALVILQHFLDVSTWF
jgi:hypothetical protein